MQTNINGFFGVVLKRAREDQHITQEDLAFKAHLDRTYISMLERGIRKPSLEAVISIAAALDISAPDLVRQVESMLLTL